MKPGKHNVEYWQGDDITEFFRLRAAVWNETTQVYDAGSYLNLTGSTVKAQIRLDGALQAEYVCTLADQTDLPGGVYCKLTGAQTAALPAPPAVPKNKMKWDMQVTDSAGLVRTYLAGTVSILEQVTL